MINIAIIGVGLVGSELISQLQSHGIYHALRVVCLASSKRMLLDNSINLSQWRKDLAETPTSLDFAELNRFLSSQTDPSIVIDCTSEQSVAERYPSWLQQGIHVVTPNKKGFSGELSLFNEIYNPNNRGLVYHESTVGAGLPVINTLLDLVKTGDRVTRIEGIFSGTLSYLFNEFSSLSVAEERKFSEIVKTAKELGYTEPDPRDDLNGLDVARKVIICGRVAGVKLSLETLSVENIVPEALRNVSSVNEFMTKLPEYDNQFSEMNAHALAQNEVLRYVGVVDCLGKDSGVKLGRYPASHPFASLKGSDNIIKFTTQRFPNGLIIQGAGAGAAVTAFGIFSDILKVKERAIKVDAKTLA
ncbi:uncharacterized protein VTP21DRAFT_3718 [Calcarisporiella thermophila]|uniref:uncharacterized protein n=1 Tax=Calcarisporiella thermophila TaxID=911321 RepID=UPI003742D019